MESNFLSTILPVTVTVYCPLTKRVDMSVLCNFKKDQKSEILQDETWFLFQMLSLVIFKLYRLISKRRVYNGQKC